MIPHNYRTGPDIAVVKFLVSQGADIHAKDKNGNTPLDLAKEVENTAIVKYLSGVENGNRTATAEGRQPIGGLLRRR